MSGPHGDAGSRGTTPEPGGALHGDANALGCPQLVELVTDYVEGALAPRERADFDAHLSICPGCVTYLEQVRRSIDLVGRCAPLPPPSPEVRRGLIAMFRSLRGAAASGDDRGPEGAGAATEANEPRP